MNDIKSGILFGFAFADVVNYCATSVREHRPVDMEGAANNTNFSESCYRYRLSCSGAVGPSLVSYIVANMVLSAVLAVAAVLANGLVFAAYYYSESLRRPAHVLLLSLAATDLLTGAIAIPVFIAKNILLISGCFKAICTLEIIEKQVILSLVGSTALNLSAITLDRYLAVCHSFAYPELVTNARVKVAVCLSWLCWTAVSVLWMAAMAWKPAKLFVAVLAISVIFVSGLYLGIYRELRRVKSNQQNTQPSALEIEQGAQQRKSVRTLGYIFGLLFCCFIPMIVHMIVQPTYKRFEANVISLLFASNAAFSNSSLNVFVYYWRNEEMRHAIRKVLSKIRQKFHNQVNP